MGVSPAKFESAGQVTEHLIPGVYTRRNTVSSGSGVSNGNLVILGQSMGGTPNKLTYVTNKSEAEEALKDGELLQAVAAAFNGSPDYVPQKVGFIRVNQGTQAKMELKSGDETILTLTAWDYGIHTNQLKFWLENGTENGSYSFKVGYKTSVVEKKNIKKESFTIQYIGDGESCIMNITSSGITLSATDPETSTAIDELSIAWSEVRYVSDLIERINDQGSYICILKDPTDSALTEELDFVSSVILGDDPVIVTSTLKALIDELKTISYFDKVEFNPAANRMIPDIMYGYSYFVGGTAGEYSISDWVKSLGILEQEDVQIIATPSTNDNVHALISDHCTSMSSVSKKKERTFWIGAAAGTSIESGISKAQTINNELGSLVIDSAIATNPLTGASEEISPSILACKMAGIETAVSSSVSLTNKAVKISALTRRRSDIELEKLIAGGVVTFGENEDGNLICVRSVTTCKENNLIKNERSMTRSVLYMDRDFRQAYSGFIGSNKEPSESEIIIILTERAKDWYRNNLIVPNSNGEYVFDVSVSFSGDKTYVRYSRYVRTPNNFIFGTATNEVFTSTTEV